MEHTRVVVIGAGPYGLAVSAYLSHHGIAARTLGATMASWQRMPVGMYLKSAWSASSIADPTGQFDLDHFARASGGEMPRGEPIALDHFVAYGRWFQRQAVPTVDAVMITRLARDGSGFRLKLDDGTEASAERVVVATGLAHCAFVPDLLRRLPTTLVSHTHDQSDFAALAGRRVVVLGRGQSALETAALLCEAGATVEVIARGPLSWINRTLYLRTGPARHLFYPPSDVGPPGLNWLVHFPGIVFQLPPATRAHVTRRATRPSGARWLRERVEGRVRVSAGVELAGASAHGDELEIALSDGTSRRVDHLVAATGYHPNLDASAFLEASLREQVQQQVGFPVLSRSFETSVPGLYMVGALATYSFGPLCRFVSGTRPAAQRIARHIAHERQARGVWPVTQRVDSALTRV